MAAVQRLLVVGGNGFLGSAVCKAAVSKGWRVTSISTSGSPYHTPKGHSPAWTSKVQWHAASALSPSTYSHLLPSSTAVVHTLGTLLPGSYKSAIKDIDPMALLSAFGRTWGFESGNSLKEEDIKSSYGTINRDSALQVLQTFLSSLPSAPSSPLPFVYISAEDIFRPLVPEEYITTKREAELLIQQLCDSDTNADRIRPVFIRPGLMYHAHLRPLTTPIASLLSLSGTVNSSHLLPIKPSSVLRSFSALLPSTESVANALEVPPLHVDQVAQAICTAIEREDVRGLVNSKKIQKLIGWEQDDASVSPRTNPTV